MARICFPYKVQYKNTFLPPKTELVIMEETEYNSLIKVPGVIIIEPLRKPTQKITPLPAPTPVIKKKAGRPVK